MRAAIRCVCIEETLARAERTLVPDPFRGHPLGVCGADRTAAVQRMLVKRAVGVHGEEQQSVPFPRLVLQLARNLLSAQEISTVPRTASYMNSMTRL